MLSQNLEFEMKSESKKIKIKGIPFGVLLAGKVADGAKTMTRRVVKDGVPFGNWDETVKHCPYAVGQLLYVREPWRVDHVYDKPSGSGHISDDAMIYWGGEDFPFGGRRRIARFMPKRFARTFIRVTGVRCERLREITEDDAVREGIDTRLHPDDGETVTWRDYRCTTRDKFVHGSAWGPKESFLSLWDAVNGKDAHKENPWVWVIEFERVEMPNPWNEEMGFAWGWRRAMVGFVSDACTGLVLQVVPDMATGLVVGFLNETNLGDYKTYPAAQLACQEAARNHFLNLSK